MAIFKEEATRHLLNCNRIEDFQREISELRKNLAMRGYPQHAMPNVEYDPVRRQALLQKLHAREHNCSKKRNDAVMVFKCPYTPEAQRFGVFNEFTRLKEQLQAIKGSDVLRDVRCVLSHPTSTNCFIESYGLNFVTGDLNRDTALQEVTADDDSPGGRRGLLTQTIAESVEES